MVDFADILESCGAEPQPGVAKRIYFAAKCDIDTWPALPTSPATAADMVTISADFVMETGKYFHAIDVMDLSGNIKNSLQGVKGSRSYKGVFAFKIAGNATAKEAFDRKIKNDNFAVVVEENDGTKRLFGTEKNPAYFESVEMDGGTDASKDSYETVYVIVAPVNVGLVPKFTGDIVLAS